MRKLTVMFLKRQTAWNMRYYSTSSLRTILFPVLSLCEYFLTQLNHIGIINLKLVRTSLSGISLLAAAFRPTAICYGPAAVMVVTWLILPVVICLSQRLSHACLSISNLYSETANGSLNQLSFI